MSMLFISHAPQDDEMARKVYENLRDHGVEAWIDHYYLRPGESWLEQIEHAIHESTHGLFLASPAAVRSPATISECRYFLSHNKPLHVAKIAEVRPDEMPFHLREMPMIDLTHDFNSGIARVVDAVRDVTQFAVQRAASSINGLLPPAPAPRMAEAEDISLTVEADLETMDSNKFADFIARLAKMGIRDIKVKNRGA